ncbi:MAG: uncharacterized protein JWO86_5925 [Myxococcaceae bacterium]|nr:uncharacterized protein [Myxococcaceae bacterium]
MRMQRFHVLAVALLAFPLVHCAMLPAMPQQPASPTTGASAPETTGAGVAPGAPASPTSAFGAPAAPQAKAASAAPSAPIPTTVEIHSDCTKTTPVFYGEKPKFGSGTKSSIGSNTTTSASRKSDGSLTVWIIDEQENGIASVRVEPTTKRVEIDRSCRQITAR